jgi:ribosomal protein L11 methyltransferase
MDLGGRGVEERAEGFTTFLPPPQDLDAFIDRARETVEETTGGKGRLEWGWQPHEEWEVLWRRGLGPRRITPRILVTPTWESPDAGPGDVVITLDPGMAFGTAEHATTRGCLRLLDRTVQPGDRVADVGAGSGILSVAAALLGARHVLGMELDPMSCEAASENIAANGVQDRVRVLPREVRGPDHLPQGPYEGIVANIQRSILVPLLPSFRGSLVPEGWLILSGILLEEREDLLGAAVREGLVLKDQDREGGWWSGVFTLLP